MNDNDTPETSPIRPTTTPIIRRDYPDAPPLASQTKLPIYREEVSRIGCDKCIIRKRALQKLKKKLEEIERSSKLEK